MADTTTVNAAKLLDRGMWAYSKLTAHGSRLRHSYVVKIPVAQFLCGHHVTSELQNGFMRMAVLFTGKAPQPDNR
jgi:hypothetical protein